MSHVLGPLPCHTFSDPSPSSVTYFMDVPLPVLEDNSIPLHLVLPIRGLEAFHRGTIKMCTNDSPATV